METSRYRVGIEVIVQRHQDHALMVAHIGTHDARPPWRRLVGTAEIDGLVQTELTDTVERRQTIPVAHHSCGLEPQRHRAGVGRHNDAVAQIAANPQCRPAEEIGTASGRARGGPYMADQWY